MTNVTPLLEPDAAIMLRHLEHLFGGDLDGCQDGLVEIAWTDGAGGRLQHARLVGTDDLDEAAEFAAATNRIPGQNIYVGAALRKSGTPPFGRADDNDVLALPAFYVDLDDAGAADAAKSRYRHCPPTAAVVTGRHPHLRVQLWWRHESPERDTALCRRQNRALALAFGGDIKVVNPSRVMRLAGSVAWPSKPGRVLERTELHTFADGRPVLYLPGQLAKVFPPEEAVEPAPTSDTSQSGLAIGNAAQGVGVAGVMAAVRAGDHWHDNMVRLAGHWIARGWSDAEIIAAAQSLTLPGWTADQTRAEVTAMIAGGRAKWAIPDPDHALEEDFSSGPPLEPGFLDAFAPGLIPRRRWVLGRMLLRRAVTVMVAPPGVGKSTLSIEQAVAVATGREITNLAVHESARVWLYNNEDDLDELKRRLAAVLEFWRIPFAEIRGRVALNSGADRPLLVATRDSAGNVLRRPDVDACIEHVRRHAIGVLVVDPFVETHAADENSNDQMKAVAAMFREIAQKGDCSVLLVHHTAKPPQGSSDGHAGNMNTARGASALPGIARVVQTLFSMSASDAEKLNVSAENRHRYIRLDDAKANLGLISADARWFRREGVTIANGDEVGVLVPEDLADIAATMTAQVAPDVLDAVLAEIGRAWDAGDPYSDAPQARDRHLLKALPPRLGLPTELVRAAYLRLCDLRRLKVDVVDRNSKRKGLRPVSGAAEVTNDATD